MANKPKTEADSQFPMTAKVHGGEYTVSISGTDYYSPITVSSSDKSFTIPFDRFADYFSTKDPVELIDRMQYFEKMSYVEFQDYFESNEEQAAPYAAHYLCTRPTKPWYRDGIPVIVYMMARVGLCKNRHERLVAMFYDLVCENGMPVEAIEQDGFNECVYEALRVYVQAYNAKTEQKRMDVIAESGNALAIAVKRYDLECLVRYAADAKSWRRRKKFNDLLELFNSKCYDQRNSQ